MNRPLLALGLLVIAVSCGCWRPYYGSTYAPPVYGQPQVYQQAPVMQAPPVVQQAPVIQQGCAPVCQPNPCCTPYGG